MYEDFKDLEHYFNTCPASNQPSRSFATAKTQKFSSIKDIALENSKLRTIMEIQQHKEYHLFFLQ